MEVRMQIPGEAVRQGNYEIDYWADLFVQESNKFFFGNFKVF